MAFLMDSTHARRRRGRMSDINITPMVDVMLVLLVVFMVTAPLLTTGLDVELPQGGKNVLTGADKAIDITINDQGHLAMGGEVVALEPLMTRLAAMQEQNPNLSIVISGDKQTAYGMVVYLMGKLKSAGFQKVGLKTAPLDEPKY